MQESTTTTTNTGTVSSNNLINEAVDNSFTRELTRILDDLATAAVDAAKLDSGNVSAGKRLREKSFRAISELKNLRREAQERRNNITASRRNLT